jgi:hypothetical protein
LYLYILEKIIKETFVQEKKQPNFGFGLLKKVGPKLNIFFLGPYKEPEFPVPVPEIPVPIPVPFR